MKVQFVVQTVEQWLTRQGFELVEGGNIDIVASKGKSRWQIEAKGETAALGTDFYTGLGQIIVRATDRAVHYGLAMPNTTEYRRLCAQVPEWLHQALKLHWLLVSADGSVEVVPPG